MEPRASTGSEEEKALLGVDVPRWHPCTWGWSLTITTPFFHEELIGCFNSRYHLADPRPCL